MEEPRRLGDTIARLIEEERLSAARRAVQIRAQASVLWLLAYWLNGHLFDPGSHSLEVLLAYIALSVARRGERGLAHRGLTKVHGAAVLVSEATRALCADTFQWTATAPAPIRGKAEQVITFIPSRPVAAAS